eukprot:516366-Hanusia_phi.AAC.1
MSGSLSDCRSCQWVLTPRRCDTPTVPDCALRGICQNPRTREKPQSPGDPAPPGGHPTNNGSNLL